jgi:hypothetical protein
VVCHLRDVVIEQVNGVLSELEAYNGAGLGGTNETIPSSAIGGTGPDLVTVDTPAPSGKESASLLNALGSICRARAFTAA